MPVRVSDDVQKCVCFIYMERDDGTRVPVATAFFVSVPRTGIDGVWPYLVTARHVLAEIQRRRADGNFWLRLNAASRSGVVWSQTSVRFWKTHPDESLADDVAVLAWAPSRDLADFRAIPLEVAATPAVLKAHDIGVGEELFFPGLFVDHAGSERNIPIVREGSIAAMPEEPIRTKHGGNLVAYLVEARSIGGLSGSPVFVNLGLFRRIDGKVMQAKELHSVFFLLGLVHGHYAVDLAMIEDATTDGLSGRAINQGIAIVVPVDRILDNVNRSEFVSARGAADRLAAQSTGEDDDHESPGVSRR